ncbi:hypothetical protein NDU88_005221 [Pleurodeles waltl]|uniref:Uncharacterized protein n=1 Tax=Pleurodeles waltl TaxID=8319 RepID=A0AAV7NW01_PLEWA|nr:hypothetical protein NDU88_005221 [Pleurodeles waltl]
MDTGLGAHRHLAASNEGLRKYSFYSYPHKVRQVGSYAVHCRITDPYNPSHLFREITIRSQPAGTDNGMGRTPTPIPMWWLQPLLLEDTVLKEEIEQAITNFFVENAGTASSLLMEWEAFKVVIRGTVVGTTVGARALITRELECVEDSLGKLETEAVHNLAHAQALQDARAEHAELLEQMRVVDHAKYRERAYSEGDRAGTSLARLIKDEPPPQPYPTHLHSATH